jgi:arylsulfatase A-like enzyme
MPPAVSVWDCAHTPALPKLLLMKSLSRTAFTVVGLTIVLALGLSVLLPSSPPAKSRELVSRPPPVISTGPNIMVIVTDDQRAGLEVMPTTRRIFEAGGTRFTNAFVSDPLCCPSRASIFTGRYPHNHHVETEEQARNLHQASTIQHYLQQSGYRTALFGKYLNSWSISLPPPSFDRWATFRLSSDAYRGGKWNVDGEVRTIPTYATSYISAQARSFLREADAQDPRQPWFLYLAPPAPHFPYTATRKYEHAPVPRWHGDAGTTERDTSDKPWFVRSRRRTSVNKGNLVRRKQLRTLMSVDNMVGKVFHQLNQSGETRDTLAFFTSDNGFLWGEHSVGGKTLPYTESIRVPFLARWPGHFTSGGVEHRLVSNVDITPTIMKAAGLRPDARFPMDGRPLLDRLPQRKMILTEYFNDPNFPKVHSWSSIRTRQFQYTEYYDGNRVSFSEYYNLITDPGELHNVIGMADARSKAATARAATVLGRVRDCSGASCP